MANILFSILSTFDDKGLKKGKKQISAFDKQITKFGKTFATVFGARALFNFSKNAVKAFAADEKAAKSLEIQLKNTGFAFSAPSVEYFIANLQKTTGVLDDELRPAFQKLLTVTGSITKSQDALQTALDVSAAGYGSVVDVSEALAKGFAGQTTALGKLIPSLDKATLKSGDMNKIMRELNNEFASQSAARLTTYAGKMDLLKVASENVKEEIGKGIIDALDVLSKDTSIQDTAIKMENLGKTIADVITGVGVLIAELQKIPGVKQLQSFLFDISVFGSLARLGKMEAKPAELPFNQQRSASRISTAQSRLEDKLSRAKALELATLLKKNAIENKNVEELRKRFDLERIGLTAALNSATDEETKLRLRGQLAILDNNDALAKKILAEMDATAAMRLAAENATKLAEAAGLASAALYALATRPNPIVNMSGELTARGRNQIAPDNGFIVPPSATGGSTSSQTIINMPINAGTIVSEGELTSLIADTIRVNLKYGNKLVPAGSIS